MKHSISIMYKVILFIVLLNVSGFARVPQLLSPSPIVDTETKIRLRLQEVMFTIRNNDKAVLNNYFTSDFLSSGYSSKQNEKKKSSDVKEEISLSDFTIEILNVSVQNANAVVSCKIFSDIKTKGDYTYIKLSKVGENWKIKESPFCVKYITKLQTIPASYSVNENILNIINCNKALLSIFHPLQNDVSVINRNYTVSSLDRKLFGNNSKIDLEASYLNINSSDAVGFYLDSNWTRIVYTQKSGDWIKSYGDNLGDKHFEKLTSITCDARSNLFVADAYNRQITKLHFNPSSQEIELVSSYFVNGLVHPQDISVKLDGEPNSSNDNRIWIADDISGKLFETNMDLTLLRTVAYYTFNNETFRLNKPRKILAAENYSQSPYIGVIDEERNSFILLDPTTINILSFTIHAVGVSKFSMIGSHLTSIGQDLTGEWWVTDDGLNKIHKFSTNGIYIASMGGFNHPQTITKSPWLFTDNNIYRSQYIYTAEPWSDETGLRAFFPGADAVNIQANKQSNNSNVHIEFTPTNLCYVKAYIQRKATTWCSSVVIATLEDNIVSGAYPHIYDINSSSWLPGDYILVVKVLPFYNNYYGDDAVDWYEKHSSVINIPTSLTSTISGSVYSNVWTITSIGGTGQYYNDWYFREDGETELVYYGSGSSALRGIGNIGFTWEVQTTDLCLGNKKWSSLHVDLPLNADPPSLISPSNGAQNISITLPRPKLQWSGVEGATSYNVKLAQYDNFDSCTSYLTSSVTNIEVNGLSPGTSYKWSIRGRNGEAVTGWSSAWSFVTSGTGSGCPFVYTWNGETYIEDNNILPQTELPGNEEQDVTDYYKLFTAPTLVDERYKLAVGEFEEEHSRFDNFKLLIIDHSPEATITVDDSGNVIQFTKPAYIASAELDSEDVLKQLYELDYLKADAAKDDSMQLIFTQNGGATFEKGFLLVANNKPNSNKKNIAGSISVKGTNSTETFSSFRLRRKPSYTWMLVNAADTSALHINIQWKQDVEIDYAELSEHLQLPFTVRSAQFLKARHSVNDNVLERLLYNDNDYSELLPGEWLELEFTAPPLIDGKERSFIFVSRGKYERIAPLRPEHNTSSQQQQEKPKSFSLEQNYPNPFNPVTTIRYAIAENSFVTLKIFDILGKEVISLVNTFEEAGYKSVQFDATNLPSGIYIYKLTAGNFTDMKKMIVMK